MTRVAAPSPKGTQGRGDGLAFEHCDLTKTGETRPERYPYNMRMNANSAQRRQNKTPQDIFSAVSR
jgi:hypothetical protein